MKISHKLSNQISDSMQTGVCIWALMQAIEGEVFQDLNNFDIEIKYCSIVPFYF